MTSIDQALGAICRAGRAVQGADEKAHPAHRPGVARGGTASAGIANLHGSTAHWQDRRPHRGARGVDGAETDARGV